MKAHALVDSHTYSIDARMITLSSANSTISDSKFQQVGVKIVILRTNAFMLSIAVPTDADITAAWYTGSARVFLVSFLANAYLRSNADSILAVGTFWLTNVVTSW